jgi:hypothetical protein
MLELDDDNPDGDRGQVARKVRCDLPNAAGCSNGLRVRKSYRGGRRVRPDPFPLPSFAQAGNVT